MTLVIDQLSFAYDNVKVLQGISVRPEPGRLTVILGPNASGKSTLLRCIMGSLKPLSGSVLVDGRPSHTLRARHLAQRMAYVAQRSTVSAAFTVQEVVELGRYALPPDRDRVQDVISRLDLADVAARPYAALSVGQQQRAMLARALAQLEPDGYLLLDEPTSAMDLRHIHETANLLRNLVQEGLTVLMVAHDVSLAATIAQDAWLLDQGILIASGPAADVLTVESLNRVFNVPFEWYESPNGGQLLASQSDDSSARG